MSFESTLDTRSRGSKHFFLLLLLTFFLATGYQTTVQADHLIGGTISLPGGDVSPAGGLELTVYAYDTINYNSYGVGSYIPEGHTSAIYTITVPSDASAQWRVYYRCSGCESYVQRGYYAAGGTTWDSSAATLLAGAKDHSGIDLTLLTGNQISGSVSLPAGDVAPAGGLWLDVSAWDTINYYSSYVSSYIPEGEVSATYNMTVPPEASSQWRVSYGCSGDGCESYAPAGYYATGGTTWDYSVATLLTGGSDHSGIDLTLLPGDQISGSVSLPAGDVAPAGGLWINVYASDTINYHGYGSGFYIPEGETSVTYSMTVYSDVSAQWGVNYSCYSCESYVQTGYYATGGTTWDSSAATLLAGGSDHYGIDLTLLTGDQISGSVSLPAGDVAPAGGLWLDVGAWDTVNSYSSYVSLYIPEGEVSATYSMTVPSDALAQWRVSYSCYNCESYVQIGYYATGGTTWDYSAATLLTGGSDHSGIDLTLLTGNQISGSVSLPAGDVAPAGGLWLNVRAGDTISGYLDVVGFSIPEGETSATYSMTVPSDASAQWRVYYNCFVEACESYLSYGYYSIGGTTWDSSAATLLAGGSDHSGIDMTLLPADRISGSVSLPGWDVAPAGGLRLDVDTRDTISGNQYAVGFYIPEGEVSAAYSLKVPSDATALWQVYYDCFVTACDSYLSVGYYVTGGTTWDFSASTLLAGGSDHSEINLVVMKDLIDSCALADEPIPGPETYNGDFYCSTENSIAAGGTLGAPSPVIVGNGGYVVYSAPVIKLMPGFAVNGGIFRAGNSIR